MRHQDRPNGLARGLGSGARTRANAALLVMALALTLGAGETAPAQTPRSADLHIVRFVDPPVAQYGGGKAGLRPTSPAVTGRRLNTRAAAAVAYRRHLGEVQARVLDRAQGRGPRIDVARSYRTTTAGFAARLTAAQVAALKADPRVAAVEPNQVLELDAVARSVPPATALGGPVAPQSAQFMGLPEGLWAQQGGPIAAGGAGSGMVIGILDTGIDPSLPSFAAASAGDTVFTGDDFPAAPPSFTGTCEPPAAGQPAGAEVACTNKIVGARWYQVGREPQPGETSSPLDTNGHGTHVASIAAGNYGVTPVIEGSDQGITALSGIAPRAHIAAYKVCPSNCPTADILAGFDDAVADGVDVINTSLGSSFLALPNSISQAGLAAQAAGVPVAKSAGNNGPGLDTVGQSTAGWWALPVASTIGGGIAYGGVALLKVPQVSSKSIVGLPMSPLVATDGSDPRTLVDPVFYATGAESDARLCKAGSMAGLPAGVYVLCDRGDTTFGEKLAAVSDAGAGTTGGVVFVTDARPAVSGFTGATTMHSMMISREDGDVLREALRAATGELPDVRMTTVPRWQPIDGDIRAPSSSGGPTELIPDLLSVAVAAPGVTIPAAYARSGLPAGDNAAFLTGTSMAAPQVAGALALLRREHPGWTPDELRSALLATGLPVRSFSLFGPPASPFAVGGGRIDPSAAADPGLVIDETAERYREALRTLPEILGEGAPVPDLGTPRDPADLNVPAIVLRSLPGKRTVQRTVRSVASSTTTWNVSAAMPAGWGLTASPASFTLAPGERRTLSIAMTAPDAAAEMTSSLVVTEVGGENRQLHLPIGARTAAAAPAAPRIDVETTGAAGTFPVPSSAFPADAPLVAGLGPMVTNEGVILADPTCTLTRTVAVPEGTSGLLVDGRLVFTQPNTPPVMTVQDPDGANVLSSAPLPELRVFDAPKAGTWTIRFDCTGSRDVGAQLKVGLLGADGVAASVAPGAGGAAPLLSWSGLPDDGDYVGYLRTTAGAPRPDQLFVVHRRPAPTLDVAGAVLDIAADDVSAHAMKVTGTAGPAGHPTWMRVEHGPTTAYGESTDPVALGAGTDGVPIEVNVGAFTGGTTRHARVVLERRGQPVAVSEDVLLAVHRAPQAQTLAATDVTATAATIRGTVDPNNSATTARLLAGPSTPLGTVAAETMVEGDEPVPVSTTLTGLTPATTYHVQVVALRDGTAAAAGDVLTFTTPAAPSLVPDVGTPLPAPSVTPSDPRADARRCATLLAGKARRAASISTKQRKRRLAVRLRSRKTLRGVRVELRRAQPCSRRGKPVARARRSSLRARRRATIALKLPRTLKPGVYVLLVSAKQGRRAVRSAAAVTLR